MLETLLIYNLIFLFSVGFAYLVEHTDGAREWIGRSLLFLVLFVPAAIRSGIGTDYVNYVDIFNSPNFSLMKQEWGFILLNKAIQAMGLSVQWVFVIVSLITYIPVAFFVRRRWILPITLLFALTCYLPSYSLIRQYAVVAFMLTAISRYLDDNRIGQVYWAILIGFFIHKSSIIYLPFVLLRKIKLPAWSMLLFLPILFVIFRSGLIDFLFSNSFFLQSDYGVYAYNQFNHETEMGSGLGVLLRMFIPLCYIFTWKQQEKHDHLVLYTIVMYMLAYVLAVQIHIFNRLTDAFSFAPILAFGSMWNGFKKKLILCGLLLLMLINFEKTIIANPSCKQSGLGITPYETIFSK